MAIHTFTSGLPFQMLARPLLLGRSGLSIATSRESNARDNRIAVFKSGHHPTRITPESRDHHPRHVRVLLNRREFDRLVRSAFETHHDRIRSRYYLEDRTELRALVASVDRLEVRSTRCPRPGAAIARHGSFHRLDRHVISVGEAQLEVVLRAKEHVRARRTKTGRAYRYERRAVRDHQPAVVHAKPHRFAGALIEEQSRSAAHIHACHGNWPWALCLGIKG